MTAAADDAGDFSLLDLFKAEVEQHAATLDEGLVAIEADPKNAGRLEALMRAAHSIKGAARIVGIEAGVRVAHGMEELLVAAQKGRVVLGSESIDGLLAGTDLLRRVGSLTPADAPAWFAREAEVIGSLVAALERASRGEALGWTRPGAAAPPPAPTSATTATPAPIVPAAPVPPASTSSPTASPPAKVAGDGKPVPAAASAPEAAPEVEGQAVRVSAAGLGRMLAYAGESLVEARRLASTAVSLEVVRRNVARLDAVADRVASVADRVTGSTTGVAEEAIAALRTQVLEARRSVGLELEKLQEAARRTEDLAARMYREVLASRMRPFRDVTGGYPRLVRDLARDLGKRVQLEIRGRDVLVDRDILERLDAPLGHMLRNALDHGIETPEARTAAGKDPEGRIVLEARHRSGMLEVEISEDGRGIDTEVLRRKVVEKGLIDAEIAKDLSRPELLEFLFLPGFSTKEQVTAVSGRGVGLDVVQRFAQDLGGVARVAGKAGRGTVFTLVLPITRSVVRAALVEIAGQPYAFPLTRVVRLVNVDSGTISSVEGRQQFPWEGRSVGLVPAASALGLEAGARTEDAVYVVLLEAGDLLYGLSVDGFLGEEDLVVRPLDPRLGKVPNVSAASVLEDGDPVLILDAEDLVRSVDQLLHQGRLRTIRVTARRGETQQRTKKRILVVDDSITVREVERALLTNRGYAVDVAVDGVDGWNAVRTGGYALVISDVDMPRMNGIDLVRRIKQDPDLRRIPVMIVSYKDREEDRMKGLEAGADAYVAKSSFHEEAWIARVVELVGEPEA